MLMEIIGSVDPLLKAAAAETATADFNECWTPRKSMHVAAKLEKEAINRA